MSGSDHTPGPWEAILWSEGRWIIKADARNVFICTREEFPSKPAESDANAYLIAAAPDLLEALRTLSDLVFGVGLGDEPDVYSDYDRLCDLQRSSRAAIAKAEGRS